MCTDLRGRNFNRVKKNGHTKWLLCIGYDACSEQVAGPTYLFKAVRIVHIRSLYTALLFLFLANMQY